jgi:hypothetical protein
MSMPPMPPDQPDDINDPDPTLYEPVEAQNESDAESGRPDEDEAE